jgi:hypothetical protein
MAARWRKQPSETGLRQVMQNPRGMQLRENEETLLHVAPLMSGGIVLGWYWYGLGMNTYSSPSPTIDEAKAAASDHYKKWRIENCRK